MGRKKQAFKNLSSGLLSQLLISILSLFTTRIIKQNLGFEVLGLNGVFTNIISFLNLSELGLSAAVTFALYKPIADNDKETICGILNFFKNTYRIIGSSIILIGLILIPTLKYFVNTTLDMNYVIKIYLLFITNASVSYFLNYKTILIRADQKNYILTLTSIISAYFTKITQLVILITTKNYLLYLSIEVFTTIVINIIFACFANKLYPYIIKYKKNKITKENKNLLITKIKALFFHKIGSYVLNGTDNIIISTFLSIKTVGLYGSYFTVFRLLNRIICDLFYSLEPSIGNYMATEKKEKHYLLFNKVLFITDLINIFVPVCFGILIKPFITVWLGSDSLLTASIPILLSIYLFFDISRMPILIFKDSAGLYEQDKYAPLCEACINLISSIILVKLIGLPGVIIGTLLSYLLVPIWIGPTIIFKNIFCEKVSKYFLHLIKLSFITSFIYVIESYIVTFIHLDNLILNFIIQSVFVATTTVLLIVVVYFNKIKSYYPFIKLYLQKFLKK